MTYRQQLQHIYAEQRVVISKMCALKQNTKEHQQLLLKLNNLSYPT